MSNLFDFTLTDIQGNALPLSQFKGKTLLVVNVASQCGLTPQYSALEQLYQQYKDQGLVVLGCPCNQFKGQEPGTEAEIKTFCETHYGVTFPLTSKLEVNGPNRHPLYQFLIGNGEEIQWNFEKFLVNGEGQIVARFSPRMVPDDPEIVSKIKEQLG